MSQPFTVIGIYDFESETGQDFFVHHVTVDHVQNAAQTAVNELGSPATVITVLAGHHNEVAGTTRDIEPFNANDQE